MPDISTQQKVNEVKKIIDGMVKAVEKTSATASQRMGKAFSVSSAKGVQEANTAYKKHLKDYNKILQEMARSDKNYSSNKAKYAAMAEKEVNRALKQRNKEMGKATGFGAKVSAMGGGMVGKAGGVVGTGARALATDYGMNVGGPVGTVTGMMTSSANPFVAALGMAVQLGAAEDEARAKTKKFAAVMNSSWGDWGKAAKMSLSENITLTMEAQAQMYKLGKSPKEAITSLEEYRGSYFKLNEVMEDNISTGKSGNFSVLAVNKLIASSGIGTSEAISMESDRMEMFGESSQKATKHLLGLMQRAKDLGTNVPRFVKSVEGATEALGEMGDQSGYVASMTSRLIRSGVSQKYAAGYAQQGFAAMQNVPKGIQSMAGMAAGGVGALGGMQKYRAMGWGMGGSAVDQEKYLKQTFNKLGIKAQDIKDLTTGKGSVKGEMALNMMGGGKAGAMNLKAMFGMGGTFKGAETTEDILGDMRADSKESRSALETINTNVEAMASGITGGTINDRTSRILERQKAANAKALGGLGAGFGVEDIYADVKKKARLNQEGKVVTPGGNKWLAEASRLRGEGNTAGADALQDALGQVIDRLAKELGKNTNKTVKDAGQKFNEAQKKNTAPSGG